MTGGTLGRRVRRLERSSTVDLPFHLPPTDWTDGMVSGRRRSAAGGT